MKPASLARLAALLSFAVAAPWAWAYIRSTTTGTPTEGTPLVRTDFADIAFLRNDAFVAGALNADGQPMVTGDSDVVGALRAALEAWTGVPSSAVRFRDLATTNAANDRNDNRHVFVLRDTPAIRDLVGSALGITTSLFSQSGQFMDTDIVFNPNVTSQGARYPFSTTLASGTFDLESVASHELGHALGAGHTAVLVATMFQSGPPASRMHAIPKSDDRAFATAVYPAAGAMAGHGRIQGLVSFAAGGGPVRAAQVVAVEAATGVVISGLSGLADGRYTIDAVPPGSYLVSAEPLDGPVFPGNVRLRADQADLFQTGFLGGNAAPLPITVSAGSTVTADIAVQPGTATLDIQFLGLGNAGGSGDFRRFSGGGLELPSGATDLVLWGPGLDGTISNDHVRVLAPGVTLRPGTVRLDPNAIVNGAPVLRLTVDVAARLTPAEGSIAILRNGAAAVFSGSLSLPGGAPRLTANGLVNAASFTAGAAAAEGIFSLFAENLADRLEVAVQTPLPTTLAGTVIEITDSAGATRPCPQFFISPGQVNFQIAPGTALGPAQLRVRRADGASGSAAIEIGRVHPGLFSMNSSGEGVAAALGLRIDASGNRSGADVFRYDAATGRFVHTPIDLGPAGDDVYLLLFGTGIRGFTGSVTATLGGLAVPVLGAVPQGEFVGLDQVNIGPVPRSLAGRGVVDLRLTVDGAHSNTLTVQIR